MVGHSLLSPLMFILAFELYQSSGSRSFVLGHASSIGVCLLFATGLCSGLNFGLPPFLNFWVEVSLFSVVGYSFSLAILPLMITAFATFLYSILFYVLACGGPSAFTLHIDSSLYIFLPSVSLSFLLSLSSSSLLF